MFSLLSAGSGPYPNHPASELFPMMTEKELADLASDIKASGLRDAIVLSENQVLDGRNRLLACAKVGVTPRFERWIGDSPTAYVLSKNLYRRHLSVSQQAMIGAESVPMFSAEAKRRQIGALKQNAVTVVRPSRELSNKNSDIDFSDSEGDTARKGMAVTAAAEAVGVGATTVQRARAVIERAPDQAQRVRSGEITVNAAYDRLPARTESTAAAEIDTSVKEKVWSEPRRVVMRRRVGSIVSGITGFCLAIEHFDAGLIHASCQDDAKELVKEIEQSIQMLSQFKNVIQKGSSK